MSHIRRTQKLTVNLLHASYTSMMPSLPFPQFPSFSPPQLPILLISQPKTVAGGLCLPSRQPCSWQTDRLASLSLLPGEACGRGSQSSVSGTMLQYARSEHQVKEVSDLASAKANNYCVTIPPRHFPGSPSFAHRLAVIYVTYTPRDPTSLVYTRVHLRGDRTKE